MPMRYCENEYFVLAIAIDDAEGKLVENVSAASREIDWPAVGSLCNGGHRPLNLVFKIECGVSALLVVPSK